MNLLPKYDNTYCSQILSIPVKTQENCAKTQAIPKKLKQIPKKLKDFPKKLKVPEDFPYLILQKSVIKKSLNYTFSYLRADAESRV